jgi:uridylate kinase
VKRIVVSLGGSLLYKNNIELDIEYIQKFCSFIRDLYPNYWFLIVVGGGRLARALQRQLSFLSDECKDWIGIRVTQVNAEIVKQFLRDISYEEIITNYSSIPNTSKIVIGAGWKPGRSTDFCAVYSASLLGIKEVLNLSCVDGIYVDDKLVKRITYEDLKKMIPEWKPGMNFPIDEEALEIAHKNNIKFVTLNGRCFENIKNYLSGKDFKGTVII